MQLAGENKLGGLKDEMGEARRKEAACTVGKGVVTGREG